MKLSNFVGGLITLLPFYKGQDGYHVGAEHDEFYCYATDVPLDADAIQKMIELGWHQEYAGRDYNKDFSVDDYRADEGWVAYT